MDFFFEEFVISKEVVVIDFLEFNLVDNIFVDRESLFFNILVLNVRSIWNKVFEL